MSPTLERRILIASITMMAVMQTLDTTIAIVALPHMQGSMSATTDQIAWVLTSYIVACAVMLPTTGFLSQRFGRKKLLLITVTGFVVASMLCGAAQTLGQIVFFRFFQGISAAFFMPLSQTIVLDSYPPEQRAKMMSVWAIGVMVGPVLGPMIGGWLTDNISWRWIFYINLPFGLLSFLGLWIVRLDTARDPDRKFDWQGFAYLTMAIGVLQVMLDRGTLKDWFSSTEICIEAIISVLSFYLFTIHSLTTKNPFLNFNIFRDRNFNVTIVLTVLCGLVLYATLSLMPPFLQSLLDYPVLTTGVVLAPRGASMVFGLYFYGRMSTHINPRIFLITGLALLIISLWQMQEFDLNIGPWEIIWSGVIQGLGLGLAFGPIAVLGYANLPQKLLGDAAAVVSLARNLGSSFGISIVVACLAHLTQTNHASLSEHLALTNPIYRAQALPGLLDMQSPTGLALLDGLINRQAETIAYLNDFRLVMWFTIISTLSVLLVQSPKKQEASATSVAQLAVD